VIGQQVSAMLPGDGCVAVGMAAVQQRGQDVSGSNRSLCFLGTHCCEYWITRHLGCLSRVELLPAGVPLCLYIYLVKDVVNSRDLRCRL
jgi:hypothetical protein